MTDGPEKAPWIVPLTDAQCEKIDKIKLMLTERMKKSAPNSTQDLATVEVDVHQLALRALDIGIEMLYKDCAPVKTSRHSKIVERL